MIVPIMAQFYYNQVDSGFIGSGLVSIIFGVLFFLSNLDYEKKLTLPQAFLLTALSWLSIAIFGSLPFVFSDLSLSFTNAFFESMSGITTTGSTILTNLNETPKAILLWRAMLQWLGGIGIIVMAITLMPIMNIGGMQLFVAEAPVFSLDKLQPRIKETAQRLWLIYISFTILLFFILWAEGMDIFDAVNHAMTTFATGGFSTKNASIGYFESPLIQYTIILFMFISATNFTLTYFALKLDFKKILNNEEFKIYLSFIIILTLIVFSTLYMIDSSYAEETFRGAFFNIVSIVTTTGFTTADFTGWTDFITILFFILMFFGACAGSTSGGIKLVRHVVLLKNSYNEIKRQLHQSGVFTLKFNNRKVPNEVISNILAFMMLYVVIFSFGSIVMTFIGVDFETAIGSVAATLGNVGPGIGDVGPSGTYNSIPTEGKWVLTLLMFIGRLELFTFLMIITPIFWKNN